ncbi:hypothetical protein EJB05_31820, partial [Eragrostis curvula]
MEKKSGAKPMETGGAPKKAVVTEAPLQEEGDDTKAIDACLCKNGHAVTLKDAIAAAAAAGPAGSVTFVGSLQVALHRDTPFHALLDKVDMRVYMLLNGGDVPGGRSLSVVCVGTSPAEDQALEYKVGVSAGGAAAVLSLSASGPVPFIRCWEGHYPTDGFLFVPDAYWNSTGSVSVTVELRKATVDKGLKPKQHSPVDEAGSGSG